MYNLVTTSYNLLEHNFKQHHTVFNLDEAKENV